MAGQATYILTTGSHDDYTVLGVFTGPPGVDVAALARRWLEADPARAATLRHRPWRDRAAPRFDAEGFRAFVIREAGLVAVPSSELWLPDYGPDMADEAGVPR